MDPVTGGAVLLFRPMKGMPPRIEVLGALSYELPVEDAWISELPFGVANASRYRGKAGLSRLEAWARRLLATFGELEARSLSHGKLRVEDLWIRRDAVWVAGVGVPWPDPEPDAVRLVQVLKELAGEDWQGWRYAGVLEALADGRVSFSEALATMSEGRKVLEPLEEESLAPEVPAPKPPEPPPAVRVKGKRAPKNEKAPEAPPPAPPEETPKPPEVDPVGLEEAEAVRVKGPAKEPAKIEPVEAVAPAAPEEGEAPPEVVRIEEPEDPAFEVVRPSDTPRISRRVILGILAAIGLLILLGFGFYAGYRRTPSYVQEVTFEVVPEDAQADLIVLSAPEGSKLASGTRFAIPGKVRFDREGLYTFEVQSEGYKPKTFALEIPVLGGRVAVRLGNR